MLLQKSRNNDRQAFASMALLVFGCAMATLLMIALGVSLPTDHDVDVYTATEARDDRLMLDLAWDLDQIKELSPSSRLPSYVHFTVQFHSTPSSNCLHLAPVPYTISPHPGSRGWRGWLLKPKIYWEQWCIIEQKLWI